MELYQISLVTGIVFYTIVLLGLVIRKKMNVRHSILWFATAVTMLIAAVFPQLVANLAGLIGIANPVNFIIVLLGFFLILIIIYLTTVISWLTNRLSKLTQKYALLEKRVRVLETSLKSQSDKPEQKE